MLRAVLDTNVLVSAAVSGRGASRRALTLLGDGRFEVALSAAMVLEYEEVLLRLAGPATWSPVAVAVVLNFICQIGIPHHPHARLRPFLRDPADEFVLELAVVSSADYLVTSNLRDFAGSESLGVRVVTPGRFLALLEQNP